MSAAGHSNTGARTRPQTLALVFGAIYLLVGIVGFFVTGFSDFFAHDTGKHLLFFEINGMHNVVHILIGVAGLSWPAPWPAPAPTAGCSRWATRRRSSTASSPSVRRGTS